MFGGDVKVPGMTEKTGEICGNEIQQAPSCGRVMSFGCIQQVIEKGCMQLRPGASAGKKVAMTVVQFDARKLQCKVSRPVKLFVA